MDEALRVAYNDILAPLGGSRISAMLFRSQLEQGIDKSNEPAELLATSDARFGELAVIELLSRHPVSTEAPYIPYVDTRWYSDRSEIDQADFLRRENEAFSVIALGVLAYSRNSSQLFDPEAIFQTAFSEDYSSHLIRDGLLGNKTPPDLPELPGIPELQGWQEVPDGLKGDLDKLNAEGWIIDLKNALNEIGNAASASFVRRPWRLEDIESVSSNSPAFPKRACKGDLVTIRRKNTARDGFGTSQPNDVIVVFGVRQAEVVENGWTDDTVTVIVPDIQGVFCVGFAQIEGQGEGVGSLSTAIGRLADVISNRSPISGGKAVEILRNYADPKLTLDLPFDICVPGVNQVQVGLPVIKRFVATGVDASNRLRPRGVLGFEWEVENADQIELKAVAVTPLPPDFPNPPASPLQPSGSIQFRSTDSLQSCTVRFTLECFSQPCGMSSQSIDINYNPSIGLVFVGGGTRSAFHLGAVEYLTSVLPTRPNVFTGSGYGAVSAMLAGSDIGQQLVNVNRLTPNNSRLRRFWDSVSSWSSFDVKAMPIPPLGKSNDIDSYLDSLTDKIIYATGSKVTDLAYDQVKDLIKDLIIDNLAADIGKAAAVGVAGYFAAFVIIALTAYELTTKISDAISDSNYKKALEDTKASRDPSSVRALLRRDTNSLSLPADIKVQVPLVDLVSGELFYANQNGTAISFSSPRTVISFAIHEILIAATTVPGVYPASFPTAAPSASDPLMLVDGSLRDPVPIPAAVQAGADHLFVISPNGGVIGRTSSDPNTYNYAEIAGRAQEVQEYAEKRRILNPFEGWDVMNPFPVPVEFIEATIPLYDGIVTDPGLVAIATDYGYMRAFDVWAPSALLDSPTLRKQLQVSLRNTSDGISALRISCWQIENQMEAMQLPSVYRRVRGEVSLIPIRDGTGVPQLRTNKATIHSLLVQRLTLVRAAFLQGGRKQWPQSAIPPGWEKWFGDFERHPFLVGSVRGDVRQGDTETSSTIASPWTSLDSFRLPANGFGAATPPNSNDVSSLLGVP